MGDGRSTKSNRYSRRQLVGLFLGPAAFAAMISLPPPGSLEAAGWHTAAVATWMALWWITEAIPVPATALLPLILFPALGVNEIKETAAPYANPLIFLFLGGFLIALAIQRWDLHRRIALAVLIIVGPRPSAMLFGFMVATALLSMWVSNTATAAIMLPVGISMIDAFARDGGEDPNDARHAANFPIALMLAIAYGATIGGLGTLIGTPPNALLAAYMLEAHDRQIGFAQWMAVGLPLVVVLLPAAWLILARGIYPVGDRPAAGGRAVIRERMRALGPMTRPEKMTAGVFALTAVLWIARPFIADAWPSVGISDAQIAMFGAILLFVLPSGRKRGEFLLDWRWASRLPWQVLILFGGGLSLAAGIGASGLADWISASVVDFGAVSMVLIVLALAAVVVFLTELTSNTATAATFLPVVGAAAIGFGHDPMLFAGPVALAASCAFMMPAATPPNAIIFGSGRVTIPQMCRAGVALNILCIGVITVLGYLLIGWVFTE